MEGDPISSVVLCVMLGLRSVFRQCGEIIQYTAATRERAVVRLSIELSRRRSLRAVELLLLLLYRVIFWEKVVVTTPSTQQPQVSSQNKYVHRILSHTKNCVLDRYVSFST